MSEQTPGMEHLNLVVDGCDYEILFESDKSVVNVYDAHMELVGVYEADDNMEQASVTDSEGNAQSVSYFEHQANTVDDIARLIVTIDSDH